MKAIVAAVVILLAAARAEAQSASWDFWRDITWAVDLDVSARYAANAEDWADGAEKLHQTTGNIELRGLGGKSWFTLALAIDVEVGFEVPGAFVYGFHFSPIGMGARFGKRSYFGILGGVGFGGVTSRLPFAGEFPVDVFLGVDLGGSVRVEGLARAIWTPGCERRQRGAPSVDFTDEAEARIGLAIGKRHDEGFATWSDGTYVGLFAREQDGARIVGVMIGLSGNGASGRDRAW